MECICFFLKTYLEKTTLRVDLTEMEHDINLKAFGKQLQQLRIDGIYSGTTSTREEQYIEVPLTALRVGLLLSLDGGKSGSSSP